MPAEFCRWSWESVYLFLVLIEGSFDCGHTKYQGFVGLAIYLGWWHNFINCLGSFYCSLSV